jgi:hypothetical protein
LKKARITVPNAAHKSSGSRVWIKGLTEPDAQRSHGGIFKAARNFSIPDDLTFKQRADAEKYIWVNSKGSIAAS